MTKSFLCFVANVMKFGIALMNVKLKVIACEVRINGRDGEKMARR